ncbi:VP6 [Bluetongue virus]|uniref:VP6 n=1 Tax=Bluetongue virus TaxID=40051 RepID=G8H3E2_BTV|nr:VP6 [Bluetongue virus]
MSAAILLAPGDVIKRSTEELRQRHIQFTLVDWEESEKQEKESSKSISKRDKQKGMRDGEETQPSGGKKEEGGEEAQNADVDGRIHTAVGSGPGAQRSGGSTSQNANGGDGETGRRDRTANERDGTDGADRGRWVVLSDEIARAIESKYGTKVEVYADEPAARIIEIERNLQKELGITREGVAEQTERLREIRRRERMKEMNRTGKKNRPADGKKGGEREKAPENRSNQREKAQLAAEIETGVAIEIEGVMSQKKLLSMIGGAERKVAPIGARESAVALVSNSLKDVPRATAYFTAPTGDPKWKEVAREASRKENILAYTSTGGDVKTEFLHLIDHL